MKVMVCANLLVGDAGTLNMTPGGLARWQEEKIEALASALEEARSRGAEICIIAGGLFAEGFVPQSLFRETVEELSCHGMAVMYAPLEREAVDLEDRLSVPDGVTIVRDLSKDLVPGIRIVHSVEGTEIVLAKGDGPLTLEAGLLEPCGFGEMAEAGFYLLEIESGVVIAEERIACAQHPFITRIADLEGVTQSKKALAIVLDAINEVDESACLRLVLRGSAPLGVHFNPDDLRDVLAKRYFYAEVIDDRVVDIDEAELENDLSLMAEFIRIVLGDDTLSSTEKSRIMRCGWNALNGKELAE